MQISYHFLKQRKMYEIENAVGKYTILEIFNLKFSTKAKKIPLILYLLLWSIPVYVIKITFIKKQVQVYKIMLYLTNRLFNRIQWKLFQYCFNIPLNNFFLYVQIRFNRNNIDFIRVNGVSAKRQTMKRSPSVNALDELKKKEEEEYNKHRKGEVPK